MCIFKRKRKLEIGQIWKMYEDDPFNSNQCAKIVDLKNGWVQYYGFFENDKKYHILRSDKERDFRWLYEGFVADNRESLSKI
jgi:hypothetical protein